MKLCLKNTNVHILLLSLKPSHVSHVFCFLIGNSKENDRSSPIPWMCPAPTQTAPLFQCLEIITWSEWILNEHLSLSKTIITLMQSSSWKAARFHLNALLRRNEIERRRKVQSGSRLREGILDSYEPSWVPRRGDPGASMMREHHIHYISLSVTQ